MIRKLLEVLSLAKRCYRLFSKEDQKKLVHLLIAAAAMSVLELVGIASILPFMNALMNPESLRSNEYVESVYTFFAFTSDRSFLIFLAFFSGFCLVIGNAVKALTTYMFLRFSYLQNYKIGERILKNYLGKEYEYCLNRNSSDLAKMVLSEVGQLIGGIVVPMLRSFGRICSAFLILVMLVLVDPVVAFVMAAVLSTSYLVVYLISKEKITRLGAERIETNKFRFRLISEIGGGIKEIKLMNKEAFYIESFKEPSIKNAYGQAHNAIISELPRYFLEAVAFGGILLMSVFLIATHGQSSAISLLALYAFAGYKMMPSLQEIFASVTRIQFTLPVLGLIEKYLEGESDNEQTILNNSNPLAFKKTIELKDVSFRYKAGERDVLKGINLSIPISSSLGIVGATGGGKTTLVDIILGLLSPQKGRVLIDGVELSPRNLKTWQAHIGYVPQFIYLADDTVWANVAFGIPRDKVDLEKVRKACRLAQIAEFIENSLPGGYNAIVGEHGVRLSGGQRQRLGIARALYHEPELLVFDEATSSLDNETERAVIDSINSLMGQKTIIMIAHRLSTLVGVDQLIKLETGTVVKAPVIETLGNK